MTVMLAREVRINLILAMSTTVLGVLMRVGGILALKNQWFLPEYTTTTKGVGGALIVLGLLWLGLSLIKRMTAPPERAAR